MPEYIERERLLVLAKYIANMYSPTGLAAPKIIKLIERLKKSDVVEVVRCKDCEHYVANYCTRDIKGRTNMFYMTDNDFCSYGKRKEGVEE